MPIASGVDGKMKLTKLNQMTTSRRHHDGQCPRRGMRKGSIACTMG